jgi:hypothetical protein
MNIPIKTALRLLIIVSAAHLINSCQDPMYDLSKGINTEITIGGDSLTIPIGTTDTIRLKDFLSTDDLEFLEIMEDGGYGLRIADSIIVDDLLKDLDKSTLKFEDYIFSERASISFGDISLDEFKIPGFSKRDTLDLNIPDIKIEEIDPNVNISNNFSVDFSKYDLDPEDLLIADIENNTSEKNFLADLITIDAPTHPAFEFVSTDSLVIVDDDGEPLKVKVNYSIEVPEGITKIWQIDLEKGATLEISIELTNAQNSLSGGIFTPSIYIDPTNLFKFENNPLKPLKDGKIHFGEANTLTNFNNYKSEKSYTITALKNLPSAINNLIDIEKDIQIEGKMTARGTVRENKANEAKEIDLIVNVVIKDMVIENMDFDIPDFTTPMKGESSITIQESGLPEQVKRINNVYFGKAEGSELPTNLIIQFMPSDLPIMKSSTYTIDQMSLTFPSNFAFSNMAGHTYNATNVEFDPAVGYTIELDISEIDLSSQLITEGQLNWSGDIEYDGTVRVNGRMDSRDISKSDPAISLTTQSAILSRYANVETNDIEEDIETSNIEIELDIDISDQVARLTTINMQRGAYVRVNILRPQLPLDLSAKALQVQFSDLFEFYPKSGLSGTTYTINGEIPDFIELELKALHINKTLDNGRLLLTDNISISGGVIMASGNVNSNDIEGLGDKSLVIQAEVSELYIESTSVEMKTLEAVYSDISTLDLKITDLPTEIVSLDSIILQSGSSVELQISISNLPNMGGSELQSDILISFPTILGFGNGQVNEKNQLVINEPFVNGKLTKTIQLNSLKFDGSDLGGNLIIDEKVSYDVVVRIENPTVNSDDLTNDPIDVEVKVTLKGLEFNRIYGKFDVKLGDQLNIGNIALDLPEMFKGNDVVLDIANPVLTLNTSSNIGIPVDAELALLKYIGGQLQTNDKISFNFRLPKSSSPLETIITNYWVAPSDAGKPANYTYLATNLQTLVNPLPDSVKIEINPSIDTGQQHLIDLQAMYSLKVKYGISIPFTFGKDLSITLRDTIDNVDLGMEENELKTGSLELLGTIENSIPLNLELQLWLTDANYNILATSSNQLIQAGAPDGSGVVSEISVKIAENLEELGKLNKVILTFKATSNTTVAGTPIKPENYIKASLKARVGGIKVTL